MPDAIKALAVAMGMALGHTFARLGPDPEPGPNTLRLAEETANYLDTSGFTILSHQWVADISGHDATGLDHMEEMWRIADLADELAAALLEQVDIGEEISEREKAALAAWQARDGRR